MKKKKLRPVKKGSPALKQLNKLKPIILFMMEKYQPKCFFCRKELAEEDLFLFTIHHVDQNRENGIIGNKEAAHRRCHKAYHRRQAAEHSKADIFVCSLRTFLMSSDGQIPDQPLPIDHWVDGRCSHCGAQRRKGG